MRNARYVMGDMGASTRPISFAPEIKSNKERLLKKFREKLGAKGYNVAEAMKLSQKVRSDANALALEVNARQGNDDPVRMANIHTMALKMKIQQALTAAPAKTMKGDLGRLSKTSPMSVSVADQGKAGDAHFIKRDARRRDAKRESKIYDMEMYRKKRGVLKDEILNEAKRAAYMAQFNGAMGHYYGDMGFLKKLAKKATAAVKKVAAPIQKVAAVVSKPVVQAAKYTAKSVVRAAEIVKKDPIAAITKVAIAPVSLAASAFPPHTAIGKGARKVEAATIKFVKSAVDLVGKVLKFIWNKIILGAWDLIKKAFKKLFDWFGDLVNWLKQKVWDKFHGKSGISGMGEMGADQKAEEMKNLEKSVSATANRLKAKGEGDFSTGLQTYAMKDFVSGKGAAAGTALVGKEIGVTALKAILTGGTGSAALAAKTAASYAKAAVPATAAATVENSPEIGKKVVSNLRDIAFDEACRDYANDIASRKIKNPIAKAVTAEAINGELKGSMDKVKAVSIGIADPAKRQAFVATAAKLPEEKRVELMKQVAIPADFKPMVKGLDKQSEQIAARGNITKDSAQSVADFANKLGPKEMQPLPPQALQAIKVEGKIVQDNVAIAQVNKGELTKTEGLIAMSPIGQKAVIDSLPPQQKVVVVQEIKNEKPVVLEKAEQIKAEEKQKTNTALLTAAAIAAKVLLF